MKFTIDHVCDDINSMILCHIDQDSDGVEESHRRLRLALLKLVAEQVRIGVEAEVAKALREMWPPAPVTAPKGGRR